jgi:hypothetical protein
MIFFIGMRAEPFTVTEDRDTKGEKNESAKITINIPEIIDNPMRILTGNLIIHNYSAKASNVNK